MPMRKGSGEKFLLITEEIEICKRLSSNDVTVRKKGLYALKQLFKNIHEKKVVDVEDFKRLWNGIFNYVWMSDKPLVQEEDVESISKLIHIIKSWELAMLYVKEFFNSLAYQWNRMSHHRTDKFLMFVRRFIRQVLFALKNSEWNSQNVEAFSNELYCALQVLPIGLVNHLSDIYIEEVAKVSGGNIPTSALILLLKCYFDCIVNLKPSMAAVNYFNSNIFSGLVKQLKLYIQQKALADADSNENSNVEATSEFCDNGEFDPRPGHVDVYLPYIELDENMVAEHLEELQMKPNISFKAKNILKQLTTMFKSISKFRRSVKIPETVLKEVDPVKRKRKKKNHETMAKLIKKSCKRLELDDVDFDNDSEKILKKLQRMNDIIQIPVGKSMFTVQKKSLSDSEVGRKRKRQVSATAGTWIVTENSSSQANSNNDVEKDAMKETADMGSLSEEKSDESIATVLLKTKDTENTECCLVKTKKRKVPSPEKNDSIEENIENFSPARIAIESRNMVNVAKNDSPVKNTKESISPAEITPNKNEHFEKTSLVDENMRISISPTKTSIQNKNYENTVSVEENVSDTISPARTSTQNKTEEKFEKIASVEENVRGSVSPAKTSTQDKNVENCEKTASIEENVIDIISPTKTPTRNKNEENCKMTTSIEENVRDTISPIETPTRNPNEKVTEEIDSAEEKVENLPPAKIIIRHQSSDVSPAKVTNRNENELDRKKKKNNVSFNLEDNCIAFEVSNEEYAEENGNEESTNAVSSIFVQRKVVVDRPKLLKPDKSYTLVDFHSKNDTIDTSSLSQSEKETADNHKTVIAEKKTPQILTSDHPAWTTVPQSQFIDPISETEEETESDYDISSLFKSPPTSKRRKSVRKPIVGEVKRSERLANKAKLLESKKVGFAGNNFQEYQDYCKSIQSRPEIPFDATKVPFKGILKPFSIPSPINPFFYPNGKRKIGKQP